jgi:hypothetical protein
MAAYEDMIRNTSRPEASWHVEPADKKWFTRLVVAAEVVEALDRLSLKFPSVGAANSIGHARFCGTPANNHQKRSFLG